MQTGNIEFNKSYPLQVWGITVLVGTALRTLTMQEASNSIIVDVAPPFFSELLLGIVYSTFTLLCSYLVFIYLIKTLRSAFLIKVIVTLVGLTCCIATIIFKFKFELTEITKPINLTLFSCYCLPLIVGCILCTVRLYRNFEI